MLYRRECKEYYQAKRIAAQRLGTRHLPSNREVHEQLLLIARQTEGEGHAARLSQMRHQAAVLMETLEEFQPRLIGSVLTGHIRQGSDIDLHVHSQDVELITRALAAYAPTVEVVTTRKYGEPREFTHIHLEDVGGFEAELTLYAPEELHTTPRCGITGRPMRRASLAELRPLLVPETRPERPALPDLRQLPELLVCRGVLQNHYHHLDVYEHTLAVLEAVEREQDPLLHLAAVCHDLAKPACQTFSRDGRIRFPDHDRQGAVLARAIGLRLGLPPIDVEDLAMLVEVHMEPILLAGGEAPPSRIHRLLRRVGSRLPTLAALTLADVQASRGPAQSAARIEEHGLFVDFLLQQFREGGFLANPCLPVSREDLIEEFALTHARAQDRLLDALLDAYLDGEFESGEEGLALASEILAVSPMCLLADRAKSSYSIPGYSE